MSNRSWNTEALVLSVSSFSSDHRNVSLLVPQEHGCTIVPATLFGGARSKLRGMVSTYQSGQVWLYSNPIKNSNKITDFSVSAYRMELRESLARSWCAAVCSEITIKTCGTVNWQLVNAFLDGLCVSDDAGCERGLLRFLWRLLQTAGVAPDIFHCGTCGVEIARRTGGVTGSAEIVSVGAGSGRTVTNAAGWESGSAEIAADAEIAANAASCPAETCCAVYSPAEDECFCSSCRRFDAHTFPLSAEAFRYLYAVTEKAPGYSRHLPLSPAAYGELKRFLFFLTEKMAGAPLKTFQMRYV
ncbi:recombination protein O [Treponema vincentii]|uniref:DNA repair protein RecO n=1 Tax=Treponema TaxID=157 RepID=UPI001BAF626C|nr:DNA repair protein RecO C-terminal domain-containing protein [Treponema vincentii]QUY18801.1 recombination protein O [Treponema vincentii]